MYSPNTTSMQREEFLLSGEGVVYSFTIVQDVPEEFTEYAPYSLALIQLDEGPIVTAQLTDLEPNEAIAIGDRVEMVTRKLTTEGQKGMIVYGYKFRKLLLQA